MTKKTRTYHTDPAHGWLEVNRHELIALGIDQQVSPYSYQNRDAVYLEEDRDMGLYLAAHGPQWRDMIEITESYRERSHVRNYAGYRPQAPQTRKPSYLAEEAAAIRQGSLL